jgi:hypothetical protein
LSDTSVGDDGPKDMGLICIASCTKQKNMFFYDPSIGGLLGAIFHDPLPLTIKHGENTPYIQYILIL